MSDNAGSSKIIVIVASVVVLGGVIFAMTSNDKSVPAQNANPNGTQGMGSMMGPVELTLNAQNNSKQNGKVTLLDQDGQTKVVIEVAPGPKGVQQPAHIHAGDCSSLGAVKYNLNPVVDGKSETILQPALHFIHGLGQTAINIHKSTSQPDVYAACGNLTEAFNKVMHMGSPQ
jgi:hypothetical protein